MRLTPSVIPLSLYLHMPWCVKKCPYCDFNSHALPPSSAGKWVLDAALERQYIQALCADLEAQQALLQGRPIHSIFIGGGTPSLISAAGYRQLFQHIRRQFLLEPDCEITLEANPGTLEHAPFESYLEVGINRLSLGVQTFEPHLLQTLGRVHSSMEAEQAIRLARQAGFKRVNVDLMHGLPGQDAAMAVADLQQAHAAGATHLSWYQLTIEPNTVFFRTQPVLPEDDALGEIQDMGEHWLRRQGYQQYEVSAWAGEQPCRHNLNYWQFGDYLAAGAGAHGKITQPEGIYRFQKSRSPKDYLATVPAPLLQWQEVTETELPFEFMMNALRLTQGVPRAYWEQRTGLPWESLASTVVELRQQGLLGMDPQRLVATEQGLRYLNTVLERFLQD